MHDSNDVKAERSAWTHFDSLDSVSERWVFSDPSAWKSAESEPALELHAKSDYQPPHRSPTSIAIVDDVLVGSFTLEVEAKQTGPEYNHRDLCVFFGFESPERFYYVHLASHPDENAHNVFLVDRSARRPVGISPARGVEWGTDQWHRIVLKRNVESGDISVYFDDPLEPILVANDSTLSIGRIGLGSFDDTGQFRNLRITAAEKLEPTGKLEF